MIDSPPPAPPRPPLGFFIAWSLLTLFAFLAFGGTAQLLQLAWGLWFSELIVFAGLAIIGLQVLRLAPLPLLGMERVDLRSLGVGFTFGAVNYVAWAVPTMALAQQVFPKSMVERFDSSQVFERNTTLELAIVLVGVSVAAPLGEELFFRGFLQRGLGFQYGAPRAVVVTAFIFSAFHLDPVGLTARFELGVLFGLLAWKLKSLWPAIGAHAANNLISSLAFLAGREAKEEDLVWWVPVVMFVVGNVALVALVRSRWATAEAVPPARAVEAAPVSMVRAFGPWVLAGLVSTVLVVAVDWRGMRLNLMDAVLETPKETRKDPAVKALRAEVRRGEKDFAEYEAMVRGLPPQAPLPDPLPADAGRGRFR